MARLYARRFVSINLVVLESSATANRSANIEYIGMSVEINNLDDEGNYTTLTGGTNVYGLYSDVSNVAVQEDGDSIEGYRYPAIFNGDVMIGSGRTKS